MQGSANKTANLGQYMPQIPVYGSIFFNFYYKYCNKNVLSIDFLFLLLHLQTNKDFYA